jgi:hypothetical protein
MRHGRLKIVGLLVLTALAGACRWMTGDEAPAAPWPPLPATGFVSGRTATREDVRAGNAVFFAAVDGGSAGKPLDIAVPQYAFHVDSETRAKTRVIVVQAEQAGDKQMIGYLEAGKPVQGVATLPEIELLGTTPPPP